MYKSRSSAHHQQCISPNWIPCLWTGIKFCAIRIVYCSWLENNVCWWDWLHKYMSYRFGWVAHQHSRSLTHSSIRLYTRRTFCANSSTNGCLWWHSIRSFVRNSVWVSMLPEADSAFIWAPRIHSNSLGVCVSCGWCFICCMRERFTLSYHSFSFYHSFLQLARIDCARAVSVCVFVWEYFFGWLIRLSVASYLMSYIFHIFCSWQR